jgi:hypothetical protein
MAATKQFRDRALWTKADAAGRAAWLLAPLIGLLLLGAVVVPLHSAMSVDDRTYLDMIDGVARHGLPVVGNGPSDDFAELRPQWELARGGRLWGIYAPIFCYVAAPFYVLDGAQGVIRLNFLLIAAVALGTFALGRRIARDPIVGVAAAYLTVAAAPVLPLALTASPYAFAVAGVTWAIERAVAATERHGSDAIRTAAMSGLLGGLATGALLLVFPMLLAVLVLLTMLPGVTEAGWLTRAARRRGLAATVAAIAPLMPVAALNRERFGSFQPISYGTCSWLHCAEVGLSHQAIGAMLRFAAPAVALVAPALLAWHLARGRRWLRAAVVVVAAFALWIWPAAWTTTRELAIVAFSFLVDLQAPLGGEFRLATVGPGEMLGPYVIKSLLQSAPWVLLLLLASFAGAAGRRARPLLAAPALALLASLLLRAPMPLAHALGYPYLHYRYLVPMVPVLAVLSAVAVRSMRWSWVDGSLLAAIALVVGGWLFQGQDDDPLLRRLLLLRVTLLLALAAPAALWWSLRRGHAPARAFCARGIVGAACGVAVALNLGLDLPALLRLRRENDALLDRVSAHTPPRFALIGWGRLVDPLLALRRTRDIEYADLYEARDSSGARALLERWAREERPVYTLLPPDVGLDTPWPDVELTSVDAEVGLATVELPPQQ